MSLPNERIRRRSSLEKRDPFASPEVYYAKEDGLSSLVQHRLWVTKSPSQNEVVNRRRASHDEVSLLKPQKFIVNVETTLKDLLDREDTDRNHQITVEDNGPKVISLGTLESAGYKSKDVRGNYLMSNLLQELTLANDMGRKSAVIDLARLNENPVNRLSRFIRDTFWANLTRVIDGSVIEKVGRDPKNRTGDPRPRIYIPRGAPEQFKYYNQVAKERPELGLDVQWLPEDITPGYVRSINNKPGLLALGMEKYVHPHTGKESLRGLPFIVPGGRFNELYGWDSYMTSLGLFIHGRVDMCKSMVQNFCFCIRHYGKILNANRSYYLCRSQPPFLTDMAIRVYEKIKHDPGAEDFLRTSIVAAIKEYYSVWMAEPRYDPVTGLSRYRPQGLGVPPETEASHFLHILTPYAEKHNMTFDEFVHAYNTDQVHEPELDEYFMHDRAVRESGHDTTYRLEHVAANLATVDLNSLLYKYETDIAHIIHVHFGDKLEIPPEFQTNENRLDKVERSSTWDRRAKRRKLLMDKYLWNEDKGMYFDYDTVKKVRTTYESATTFWTMWAGVASPKQAASLVLKALPKFECAGGLVSGTERSLGHIDVDKPNRQWDYPLGWAPQQMLAWAGLQRYSYHEEARALAYKWLYMVVKTFNDFNGIVVEKYNVTKELDPHRVDAEYGNQGADIRGVPREGFGWANASYVVGLQIVNAHMKRALGTMTPWDTFYQATRMQLDDETISEALEDE